MSAFFHSIPLFRLIKTAQKHPKHALFVLSPPSSFTILLQTFPSYHTLHFRPASLYIPPSPRYISANFPFTTTQFPLLLHRNNAPSLHREHSPQSSTIPLIIPQQQPAPCHRERFRNFSTLPTIIPSQQPAPCHRDRGRNPSTLPTIIPSRQPAPCHRVDGRQLF